MMLRKQKILFAVSLLLFLCYIGFPLGIDILENIRHENGTYLGVQVISQEQLEALTQGKNKTALKEGIFFNYVKAPLDVQEQTIYVSQNMQKDKWEGRFGVGEAYEKAGYEVYFLEDALWDKKASAIQEGHAFSLYMIGADYCELKVVFSGTAVMSITQKETLEQEAVDPDVDPDTYYYENQPEYLGEIVVLAADGSTSYQTVESNVKYHRKGATSLSYPKNSYSISFVDAGGKKIKLPLLGMDSASKWKLNALYTDNTLLREKSAVDIWKQIDAQSTEVKNGSFGAEYVELVMDGVYVGTYLLVEAMDAEKLELDQADVLYKAINWDIAEQESIDISIANQWKIQFPFRIRYPKEITDYAKAWNPIKDFSNVFWTGGALGETTLAERVFVRNLIDVDIFLEVCALEDNNYKNIYYAAHVNPDGTYRMMLHPWDFDLSFGHRYASGVQASYIFQESPEYGCDLQILDSVIAENPEVAQQLYDTYCQYRQTILSKESMTEVILQNWEYLQKSGAYARNLSLWEIEHGDSQPDRMLDFLEKRLEYTDAIYESQYNRK